MSAAVCEHCFSILHRIKTDKWSFLTNQKVENILRICINGPLFQTYDVMPVLQKWGNKALWQKRQKRKSRNYAKRVGNERSREDFFASSSSSEEDWKLLLMVRFSQLLSISNSHLFCLRFTLLFEHTKFFIDDSYLNLHPWFSCLEAAIFCICDGVYSTFAIRHKNIANFKVNVKHLIHLILDFKGVHYTKIPLYFHNFLGLNGTQSGQWWCHNKNTFLG